MRRSHTYLIAIIMLFSGPLLAAPVNQPAVPQQTAPDNTKVNKGDEKKDAVNADSQKNNPPDRVITQKIRASVMKDKSLSTYGHNVKIITQDGKVTLKGPVRSQEERSSIEAKAAEVAGESNVTSQLEVAPPK